ncbi:unnamed protein product [Linum trigynum]|uniref:Polygalacturonase n=1 Tax=Linum trigynum TaxID=586398 RepID=A0AAV2CQC0_9ROSI
MGRFYNVAFTLIIASFLCSPRAGTCHGDKGLGKQKQAVGRGGHGRSLRMSNFMGDDGHMWEGGDMDAQPKGGKKKGNVFSVLDYGAKGNGHSDDTKAFESAWAEACQVEGSTIEVPSGYVFLLQPISFSGPDCASNLIFQLDGEIKAIVSSELWSSTRLLQWIEFTKLQGITITGTGIIEGQGSAWWYDSPEYNPGAELASELHSSTKPTAVRFYGSTGVTVSGITIQNSPQTHLKFDDCTNVEVSGFTASSPGNSPNTDGIHLQNSRNVNIYSTDLQCGDDCISIQTGCSNVNIHNVRCGPGHGISIGGLGKDGSKACVSNITVRDVEIQNTLTGVRIKTWQGGSGSVQGIMFSNIQVSGVETPIVIDQFYCDKEHCRNDSSAVSVSAINYVNIKGTYTVKPVHFACSDSMPCSGVSLSNIELTSRKETEQPYCLNAYGELETITVPPVTCLRKGKVKPPVYGCLA